MKTLTSFRSAVEANGGENMVIGLNFNNAYTRIFQPNEPFTFDKYLVTDGEYIRFEERDPSGKTYVVLKPIEYIEGIMFAKNAADVLTMDRRYIHG